MQSGNVPSVGSEKRKFVVGHWQAIGFLRQHRLRPSAPEGAAIRSGSRVHLLGGLVSIALWLGADSARATAEVIN
jgi:hypothetical protein